MQWSARSRVASSLFCSLRSFSVCPRQVEPLADRDVQLGWGLAPPSVLTKGFSSPSSARVQAPSQNGVEPPRHLQSPLQPFASSPSQSFSVAAAARRPFFFIFPFHPSLLSRRATPACALGKQRGRHVWPVPMFFPELLLPGLVALEVCHFLGQPSSPSKGLR